MNRLGLVAFSLSILALGGCSKTLTPSKAVKLTQAYMDSRPASVNIDVFTNLLDRELTEPLQFASIQRALNQGLIQQKTVAVTYSNFGGQFEGSYFAFDTTGAKYYHPIRLSLQTTATRPPRVQGIFNIFNFTTTPAASESFNGLSQRGSIMGEVRRTGPSILSLTSEPQASDMYRSPPGPEIRPLQATLARGSPDVLVGTLDGAVFRVEGHTSGPDLRQDLYVYSWTERLPNGAVSGSLLKLGHVVVESCEQLLLTSETSAKATCTAHVELTKFAEAIFGSSSTSGPAEFVFGKQPDGDWVTTGVNYVSPTYSIDR